MGAKDIFSNPQFVSSNSNNNIIKIDRSRDEFYNSLSKSISSEMNQIQNHHKKVNNNNNNNNNGSSHCTRKECNSNNLNMCNISAIDEEWHQKYAFIIGLLRKPHAVLLKKSLLKERDKLAQKLSTYYLERNLLKSKLNKIIQSGTETNNVQPSLSAQMKHFDVMCVTLERRIEAMNDVDQALPTENIYSGEPDSLDGTSSEIILNDEYDMDDCVNTCNPTRSNYQIAINGRSPLDALAMLHLERVAHQETRKELNQVRKKYEVLRDEFDSGEGMSQSILFSCLNGEGDDNLFSNNNLDNENDDQVTLSIGSESNNSRFGDEVRHKELTISQLRSKINQLEEIKMDRIPVDAAKEIARLHGTLVQLERVRDELTLQNFTLKSKLAELSSRISDNATYRLEKCNTSQFNNTPQANNESQNILPEENLKNSQTEEMKLRRKSTYKVAHHNNETQEEIKQLRTLINDLQSKELEGIKKVVQLETEVANIRNKFADEHKCREEADRTIRHLEDQLEVNLRRLEATEQCFLTREEEYSALKLDLDTLNEENKRLKDDLNVLHMKVEKDQSKSIEKLTRFEREIGSILEQNKILQEDFNRERVLRKRYYNIVEELKGKIRVFCRIRPLTKNEKLDEICAKRSDPYTVSIETYRGLKEFQFDRVFLPEDTQETIFADTRNLIQSAFDGYNVCICAYGQTGSGKTFTILGDEEGVQPGIAIRTFTEIFSFAEEMSQTYETNISFYVLELYNDKLIDLLSPAGSTNPSDSPDTNKLEIKRDRRGTVWVSGAKVLTADSSLSLNKSFRQALNSRHTASTKMNDRSSRSHLVVGIIIETTSKVNGTVLRGKISLLDLAGSERTGKSGVSADTLRQANCINKSLSALQDVINALTTNQPFVPYRNNKLTLLMQDSIGGNAKTLMFVNISPSKFNLEESIVSLSYATRVKQVTNGATRNSESKEIARLRSIITRLKRGENCSGEEEL